MSVTITYYSDSTSDFPVSYGSIISSKDFLLKNSIYIPTTLSQQLYMIRSHRVPSYNLYSIFGKKKVLNNTFGEWYLELKKAVNDGLNILLYGYIEGKNIPLFEFLREQDEFKRCKFRIVLVRGRLACEMEQFSYQRDLINKENWSTVINYTINKARNNFLLEKDSTVADNVNIFIDPNEDWVASSGLSTTQKMALKAAGVSVGDLREVCPPHQLCLRSQTARSLLRMTRVDDNVWPPINDSQLVNFLKILEQEAFSSCPYAPPGARQQLCAREESLFSELETSCKNFDRQPLSCPDGLLPDVPWQKFEGVSDEELEIFAKNIPTSLAYVIKRRFLVDPELMTQEQKKLSRLLESYKPQKKIFLARQEPTLSVLTMTYNHEDYIGKCIESIQSQKTNFEIEHVIIDDCSTDSTPEIIKRYASKCPNIRPVLLGNKSSNGRNVSGLLGRCRTEFASLCDGDDYFTHSDKLQRQVDFLRDHQECSLCFHFVDVVYEDGSPTRVHPPIEEMPGGLRMFYPISALLHFNCIQTNSVVYRWRFRDGLPSWFDPTLCPGDWYWHLLHAENGLLGFIPEHLSVYRRHKKAIYIETEKGNLVLHRARFGMPELRVYHVLNTHFKGKYFHFFFKLANAVFLNFVQLYLNSGESNLLERAIKTYPLFADKFFQTIKVEANVLIPKIEKFFTAS